MHQTRSEVSTKIPIARKGTKYVARATIDFRNSVPVVIAVRDMLKLARTAKEVNEIIKQKMIKINGRVISDYHDSIRLFNILEVGKKYILTFTPTGKFTFEETKSDERLCKVIGKKMMKHKKQQFNFHDGTNLLSNDKLAINDSVYISSAGKISKHVPLEKGKSVLVIAGKYLGSKGKVEKENEKTLLIKLEEKSAELSREAVVAQ